MGEIEVQLEDGTKLTFVQATTLAALRNVERLDHWHMCVNGCCVIVHTPYEYGFMIPRDGSVAKIWPDGREEPYELKLL